jgi:hypothetical protein
MMNKFQRLLHRPFFIRLLNWEYWSFTAVYILIYPVWILLCLRARSFFFFAAANPGIRYGGFLNESKKDVFAITPVHLQPKTLFFTLPADPGKVVAALQKEGMTFPLIGKPDIGGRGRGVKKLKGEEEVFSYVQNALLDFHIQEFVPFEKEAGIFYYRMPGNKKGVISGIVRKEFLSVTGNGRSTVRELVTADQRALLQLKSLENIHGKEMDSVLGAGEERILVPYGNHARGAKFIDDSHLADEALTCIIDEFCRKIDGFYFGRLDIRYNDWELLKQGKEFSVIEVNGAGSEPTHIYDPSHSLFFAWKEIIRHWWILYRISRANHKLGYPYLTFREGVDMFREDKIISKKLEAMPE